VTRLIPAVLLAATASVAASQSQAPSSLIQNGRVETRTGQSIDQEIKALASAEPVWLAWRVPMVPGDRELCSSYYSDRNVYARGYMMDWTQPGQQPGTGLPQVKAPAGPVSLEAGTGLLVLVRTLDGAVERVRTLADDCPIDAGGRSVQWLSNVTPAESLRFLESLTRTDRTDRFSVQSRQNTANASLTAISLHRDAAADTMLDRMATSATSSDLRRQAAQALASTRGAYGLTSVQKLAASEREPEMRRTLVGALGLTREPGTAEALRPYLKDADARIRAEAIYWFAQRGGAAVVGEVTKIVEADTDDNVRRRGVSGLSRLPANDSIPVLLQLAKTSQNAAVRKAAVGALSNSKDPRAVALMEDLIKRN
jgi:HEAT repeat protein